MVRTRLSFFQNLVTVPNHTRSIPVSYPNHAPCTHPTSLIVPTTAIERVVPLAGFGVFGRRVPCLVCPATARYCLPTASQCRCGPTAGSLASPTLQFQSCESYPRIIPPVQTSRPDYGIKIHTQMSSPRDEGHADENMSCPDDNGHAHETTSCPNNKVHLRKNCFTHTGR